MKIAVDLDDVLGDWMNGFLVWYNTRNNTHFTFEQMASWDLWKVFDKEKKVIIKNCQMFDAHSTRYMRPVAGATNGVKTLKLKGYNIFAITTRDQSLRYVCEKFVNTYFRSNIDKIIFAERNSKTDKKYQVCQDLNIGTLVDDNQKDVLECSRNGVRAFLLDKPWNQGELTPGIKRVKNWQEIIEVI